MKLSSVLYSTIATLPLLEHSLAFQLPTLSQTKRLHSVTIFDTASNRKKSARRDNYDPFGDYDDYGVDKAPDQSGAIPLASRNDRGNHADGGSDQTSHFYSIKSLHDPSFRGTKLFDQLCRGVSITRPSRIQSLAWPVLLQGKHAIIADQTGSGKTLAYLMPLLQRALQSIARDNERRNGAPRLLVLAPTAELADQIRAVCDKLSREVPFKTMVISASGTYSTSIRDQIRLLQRQPVDVLISTPGRIATILRSRNSGLDLTSLQVIMLDEVNVLMIDETF
jgi:ATP-dependent RNA helicase DDX18/HAS1